MMANTRIYSSYGVELLLSNTKISRRGKFPSECFWFLIFLLCISKRKGTQGVHDVYNIYKTPKKTKTTQNILCCFSFTSWILLYSRACYVKEPCTNIPYKK